MSLCADRRLYPVGSVLSNELLGGLCLEIIDVSISCIGSQPVICKKRENFMRFPILRFLIFQNPSIKFQGFAHKQTMRSRYPF